MYVASGAVISGTTESIRKILSLIECRATFYFDKKLIKRGRQGALGIFGTIIELLFFIDLCVWYSVGFGWGNKNNGRYYVFDLLLLSRVPLIKY